MTKGRRKPRKPTGRVERVVLGGGHPAGVEQVQWPDNQDEIEKLIIKSALRSPRGGPYPLRELYDLTAHPVKNPPPDIDYSLQTTGGRERLELTELAPLDHRSHEGATTYYLEGQMADWLWDTIAKKIRYTRDPPLHLLVYSTDFRLCPTEDPLLLTALCAQREKHPFTSIACYAPDNLTYGRVTIVYPVPPGRLAGIDEQAVRSRQVALADLSRGQVYPEPGSGQPRPTGAPGVWISHVSMSVPGRPTDDPKPSE